MKCLILLECFLLFTHLSAKVSYQNHQVWRIYTDNVENVLKLITEDKTNRVHVWQIHKNWIDVMSDPDIMTNLFQNMMLTHQVLIKDVQKLIDSEEKSRTLSKFRNKNSNFDWKSYHALSEIYDFIATIAQEHPKIAEVITFGKTIEERPMKLLKISNNDPKNIAIWIDGGIHAREWISPAATTFIINHIVQNFNQSVWKNVDWYITPVLNPDGYVYSHTTDRFWRKNRKKFSNNCVGTDLNRNFGFKWGLTGTSKDPCMETFGGKNPFSEAETIAVRDFIKNQKKVNWKAFISFHSYGQFILYPWGYSDKVTSDFKDLDYVAQTIAKKLETLNGVKYVAGATASVLYEAAGGSDDWAKAEANFKYSFTIELRDVGNYAFELPTSWIEATVKDALIAVEIIAENAVIT